MGRLRLPVYSKCPECYWSSSPDYIRVSPYSFYGGIRLAPNNTWDPAANRPWWRSSRYSRYARFRVALPWAWTRPWLRGRPPSHIRAICQGCLRTVSTPNGTANENQSKLKCVAGIHVSRRDITPITNGLNKRFYVQPTFSALRLIPVAMFKRARARI